MKRSEIERLRQEFDDVNGRGVTIPRGAAVALADALLKADDALRDVIESGSCGYRTMRQEKVWEAAIDALLERDDA